MAVEEGEKAPSARLDPRTADCDRIQMLRERPRTSREFEDYANASFSGPQREIVCKLVTPNRGSAPRSDDGTSHGKARSVYYLWGDDRRAVRRFIEVNEQFVRSAMAAEPNGVFKSAWDDALYALLVEEWQLGEWTDEEGGQ